MQTQLPPALSAQPQGLRAAALLAKCVHCGFCTATCPTFQILGDELDSPRGRIDLIKSMLEKDHASQYTRLHLDRCLNCGACESTCPSGVRYLELLEIGREQILHYAPRAVKDRWLRALIRKVFSGPRFLSYLLPITSTLRPIFPRAIRSYLPYRRAEQTAQAQLWPPARHQRRMLVLEGCVQPALAPNINAAMARILDRIGISLIRFKASGCCGALQLHLDDAQAAAEIAQRNRTLWQPLFDTGVEAIIATSSACALMLKGYDELLSAHQTKKTAAPQSERLTPPQQARPWKNYVKEPSELLHAELAALAPLLQLAAEQLPHDLIAWQAPCTLQHGVKTAGNVQQILQMAGWQIKIPDDGQRCCGSSGAYSLLHPRISKQLRDSKLSALGAIARKSSQTQLAVVSLHSQANSQKACPVAVASANIGCINHLQAGCDIPVRHWLELLDERLAEIHL